MKAVLPSLLLLLPATTAQETASQSQSVLTTMCEICTDDGPDQNIDATTTSEGCKTYTTPLNKCYNAVSLFPNDPSWSNFDIYDTLSMLSMKRSFYKSQDGSCSNVVKTQEVLEMLERGYYYDNFATLMQDDDYFVLPFDKCVGPFGPPRPWGKFTLVQDEENKVFEGKEGVVAVEK